MQDLHWQNAEIREAFIGLEGHGILCWAIQFSGPGWAQGSGARGLCAESLPTIKGIVSRFGAWNKLTGKLVQVGRLGNGLGPIVAMRDILDEAKEVHFDPTPEA